MKTATAAATVAPAVELSLDEGTVSGVMDAPVRVMMYSEAGLGKTTFAADAPAPYFLDLEKGSRRFDVKRYFPTSWKDILERIERLTVAQHDRKTVVIDTLDAAEALLFDLICRNEGVSSIEKVGGGFGKGAAEALPSWRTLLYALERLQDRREMNVILLAHSAIKPFHDPNSTSYDKYIPRMDKGAAGLIEQWCDDVLFARLETQIRIDKQTKRARGTSSEVRVVHTRPNAAFYAKCRSNLPETIALDWSEYEAALKAAVPADPDELIAAITENAARLPEDMQKVTAASLARCGRNATKLAQLDNWVRAKLPPPSATATAE